MCTSKILLTGSTGALGAPILTALKEANPRAEFFLPVRKIEQFVNSELKVFKAELTDRFFGLSNTAFDALKEVELIIHSAAETKFRGPWEIFERSNVVLTHNILDFARQCPNLKQCIVLSTAAVSGQTTGSIAEEFFDTPPVFDNNYQRSKYEVEQLCRNSELPLRVIRLSTAIGARDTGYISRLGAFHYLLTWLYRGLIPMLPRGELLSPVDFISTTAAAKFVARAALEPPAGTELVTFAAGSKAPDIEELINYAVSVFSESNPVWGRGQIPRPMVVDPAIFEAFRTSVRSGGDPTLGRIIETGSSFLSALEFPRVYSTRKAESLWGGSLPTADWKSVFAHCVEFCVKEVWSRSSLREGINV